MSSSVEVKVQNILSQSPLYAKAVRIVQTLQQAGFAAYFAGGAVRDGLLGRKIKDLDIATSATPEQVLKVFEDVVEIGRAFGVMGVKIERSLFEVTTFRSDGDYADGRRPTSVQFADINSDCLRRDFTINALYFDPVSQEVIDLVEGRQDLDRRLIRTVGDPQVRFTEDHLRILRAFRFCSSLGFDIEPQTLAAAKKMASRLQIISKERITAELEKLMIGKAVTKAMILARPTGVLTQVLGFDLLNDSFHDTLKMVELSPPESCARLCALLRVAYEKKLISLEDFFLRFRFSQDLERRVKHCYAILETLRSDTARPGDRIKALGEDGGLQTAEMELTYAAVSGVHRLDLEVLIEKFSTITEGTGHLPRALLTAHHLMEQGFKPGLLFGQILKEGYLLQLEGHLKTHQDALNFLMTFRS